MLRWLILPLHLLGLAACRLHADPPATITQHAYVWQGKWTDSTDQALVARANAFSSYFVLAAEIDREPRGVIHIRAPSWNLDTLVSSGLPVHPTIRLHALNDALAQNSESWTALTNLAAQKLSELRSRGIAIGSLHLDFDCPTRLLAKYAERLEDLRRHFPEISITATALPTWMGSREAFACFADAVDGYVLQVHGLEVPKRIDAIRPLCDPVNAKRWAERASAFRRPFLIALPTYTYELHFDPTGTFLGLSAEGPAAQWPRGTLTVPLAANPEALANLIEDWAKRPPDFFEGVVWYRFPASEDRLNWPWQTLAAVMAGRTPTPDLKVKTQAADASGLVEIVLLNNGELTNVASPDVRLRSAERPLAWDALGGYAGKALDAPDFELELSPQSGTSTSKLGPGEIRVIAWIRFEREVPVNVFIDSDREDSKMD